MLYFAKNAKQRTSGMSTRGRWVQLWMEIRVVRGRWDRIISLRRIL